MANTAVAGIFGIYYQDGLQAITSYVKVICVIFVTNDKELYVLAVTNISHSPPPLPTTLSLKLIP